MKAFIESQFAYCQVVGLFHSRALNTKINHLHHRALKFVHQDELSTFQELIIKDNSVSVHSTETYNFWQYLVMHPFWLMKFLQEEKSLKTVLLQISGNIWNYQVPLI